MQEQEKLRLGKPEGNPKERKKRKLDTPEERAEFELRKTQEYQARLAKRMRKPQRIRAVVEDDGKRAKKGKSVKRKQKPQSSFEAELGDTSVKAVKKFRYGPATYKERKELGLIKQKHQPAKKFKSKSRYRRR